jgi:hypothetical protein
MIDRKPYIKSFTKGNIPDWICPTCNRGTLHAEPEEFIVKDNASTMNSYHEEWFEPAHMVEHHFAVMLTCTNPNCKEPVSVVGNGFIEEEYYQTSDGYSSNYISYLWPRYFHPALHFFQIPEDTPEDVSKAILESFSLFFTNKSSSANQIRIALECLLTHLKVKRYINGNGKRKRLNLHQRIDLLPSKYQHIKELCFAIKWLGNSGSHCGEELSSDNVFDGYDVLSVLLEELYHNKQEHAKKLAKKINTKKGI